MERRTGIIIAATIGIIVIGIGVMAFLAWRTSNEILEEFERVNSGLDSTRLSLRERQIGNGVDLDSFVCKEMLVKADSVHRAYIKLIARVDSFKLDLVRVDRFNTTAADSAFEAREQGAQLYNAFGDFFDLAERTCTNDSMDAHINQYAQIVRDKVSVEEWRVANFQRIPAIACITLLSKFQSDAVNAEALVMNDLLARCDPTKN
jgi:GldM N-terminal domain